MSPPRIAAIALAAAVALYLGYRAVRGWGETEEDRVRAVIEAIKDEVEERDATGAIEHLSTAYHDPDFTERRAVLGALLYYVRQHEKIDIRVEGDIVVRIRKDGVATAVFYARFAEGKIDSLAGGGESWRFEVDLKKEDGVWRVITHRREPQGR